MSKIFISVGLFLLAFHANAHPKFYCFQGNVAENQLIEAGFTDCGKDDEAKGEIIKERKMVCVEPAYCVPDTQDLRDFVAPYARANGKAFEKLTPFEVGKYIQDKDKAKTDKDKYAKNSYLICAMKKDETCPPPTECQEDLFYNVKGQMGVSAVGYTTYPKVRVRPTTQ